MRLYNIVLSLLLITLVGAAGCSKAKIASKATPSSTSDLGAIVEAKVKATLTAVAATATVTVAEPVVPIPTIPATMLAPTPVPAMAPTVGAPVPTPTLAPTPTTTPVPPTPTPTPIPDRWAIQFEIEHGRKPTAEDRADYEWSLAFQAEHGRPPTDLEWTMHWWSVHLGVSPGSRSVSAGGATAYSIQANEYGEGYGLKGPPRLWVVIGDKPSGTTTEFISTESPWRKLLVIRTSCSTPRGVYPLSIQAGSSDGVTFSSGVAELRVGSPLTESSSGTFTGSFLRDTVSLRTGGPSTLTNGPFLNLQFCNKPEKRVLKVIVHSVTTAQGAALPLRSPMLLETLVGPVAAGQDFYLDPVNAMNALYAAGTEPWRLAGPVGSLEWPIREGQYFLYFPWSGFEQLSQPGAGKPAYVTYQVEIVPEASQ